MRNGKSMRNALKSAAAKASDRLIDYIESFTRKTIEA